MSHAPRLFALEALVAERLSPEGKARLERHLAVCETCREALKAVRSYEALRAEARELEPPDLAWDKLEQAIARESSGQVTDGAFSVRTRPESRNGRWVALAWPVLAIAATLVVAWISKHGQEQEAQRVEAPAQAVIPPKVAALIEGRTTLVEGRVERVREGSRAVLAAGEVVREGDLLISAENAALHVALADGSGFALGASSELSLERLRGDAAELRLVRGELTSEVRLLSASERYVVLGTAYAAHVRGTRFMVRQTADFGVAVSAGRVEIRRGDESMAFVDAGQHWESAPGAALPLDRELGVYGLGSASDWPTLTLPAHPGVAVWHLPPVWIRAGGEIAMRAPSGDYALEFEDLKGKPHTITVKVLPEGTRLAESTLDKLLAAPRGTVGVLEADQISPVVRAGMGNLQRCYERALRTNPKLQGKLTLSLRVGADGRVGKAQLTQSELPEEAQRCVTDEARKWQFPHPEGGAVVFELPLNLRARN